MSQAERLTRPDSGILFLIEALGSLRELIAVAARGWKHDVTRTAVDTLIGHRDFNGCAICLSREDAAFEPTMENPESRELEAIAASGLSRPLLELGLEIAATAMRTGCAQHEPDLARRGSELQGSLIVLPIAAPTQGLGALVVWSDAPFRFQPWHENLLQIHCDILSLARRQDAAPIRLAPGEEASAGRSGQRVPADLDPISPLDGTGTADPDEHRLDPLTGLLARSAFESRLENLLEREDRPWPSVYLLYLDIDRFHLIRDYGGEQTADRVIRIIADLLRREAGREIALGRLGDDEFGIAASLDTEEGAVAMAQHLIQTVDALRMSHAGQRHDISVSIGLAPLGEGWRSGRLALRRARDACGVARRQGGGALQVYSAADDNRRRLNDDGRMLNHLTGALKEGRLRLFAQPILPAHPGTEDRVDAAPLYEVLLRMLDKQGNLHGAGAFLPLAERYGLSVKLDRWVIQETFRSLAAAQGPGVERNQLAVNLSGHSIDDARLLEFIIAEFAASGLAPERICFEITETAAISDIDAAKHFIRVLKDIGCQFALDDFGSGHSSFLYLRDLDVDWLKIDGNLVREIARDPVSLAFVRSIDDIGKIMGKRTIAEYVEDARILEAIVEIGIDFAQGFWVGEPAPLAHWLTSAQSSPRT